MNRLSLLPVVLLASVASAQTTVIFIGDGNIANSGDAAIRSFLEARYGQANVTYVDTEPVGSVTRSTVAGYDVAVLSSTPSSARYRNILHLTRTPVVNFEEAVADNSGPGEFAVTTGRTKEIEIDHSIKINVANDITKGFAVGSTVKITTGSSELWWSTGPQATGAMSAAEDDDTPGNMFLTYVDVGGALLDGSNAPCRRVMVGLTDQSFNFFTTDGMTLIGQAIDWAAGGCCAQRSTYGTGLAGQNGVPSILLSGRPVYNSTVNLLVSNSTGAATQGLVIASPTRVSVPFLGGTLLANLDVLNFLTIPAGGLTLPINIPDIRVLCPLVPGSHLAYLQCLQIDAAATGGVAFTQGLRLEVGQ